MDVDTKEINNELARFATNYYRDNFRRALKYLFIATFSSLVLAIIASYLYLIMPKEPTKFYASNIVTGKVTPLYPLSAAIDPRLLTTQSQQTVNTLFTFNFVNYQQIFSSQKGSFTLNGWQQFEDSIKPLLNNVTSKQLFVSAAVGKPAILDPNGAVIDSVRTYTIRVPVRLSYKNNKGQAVTISPQLMLILLAVTRVPDITKTEDFAISHFKMEIIN